MIPTRVDLHRMNIVSIDFSQSKLEQLRLLIIVRISHQVQGVVFLPEYSPEEENLRKDKITCQPNTPISQSFANLEKKRDGKFVFLISAKELFLSPHERFN